MDKTHLFKAAVMTAKLRHDIAPDKRRILPKSKSSAPTQRDEFARQAKDVCQKITTLRNVLLENRAAYMHIGQHLKSFVAMTDEQRDLIDREAEKFITYYIQHLAQMRAEWKRAKRKAQHWQHMDAVLELLSSYLRTVQNLYMEQKNYRVRHELETYRLLKLAAEKRKIPPRLGGVRSRPTSNTSKEDMSERDEALDLFGNEFGDSWDWEPGDNPAHKSPVVRTKQNVEPDDLDVSIASSTPSISALKSGQSPQKVAIDEDLQMSEQLTSEDDKIDPEDMQMFERENVQLYQELQGLHAEVEQIEKNVVDIAQLQDIFTEKVSMQQHNIERIANVVVGATENVKDANEQIKQAIQRNAGLRVWSLFFLLVMSFALLFLDWYYD